MDNAEKSTLYLCKDINIPLSIKFDLVGSYGDYTTVTWNVKANGNRWLYAGNKRILTTE